MLYLAVPCCSLLYLAVPCCTLLYRAVPCCTVLYRDVPCTFASACVCGGVKATVAINMDLVSRSNCTHTHTHKTETHTHTHTHTHNQHIRLEYAFNLSLEPTITHAHCICILAHLPLTPPLRSYQPHNETIAPLHTSASGAVNKDDQTSCTVPSTPSDCDRHWTSVRARTTARISTHQ